MYDYELRVSNNGAEDVPYNEPGYPVYAGKGILHSFRNMGVINHWHWDIELIYVESGAVSFTINQSTLTVHAGEGIFINSGQIHRNYSLDGTDGEYRCVLIHPSVCQTSFQKATQDLYELTNQRQIPFSILRCEISWQRVLIDNINAMYEIILSGVEDNLYRILAYAFDIVHILLKSAPYGQENNAPYLDSLREMMGYIQTHYSEKILVSDISHAGIVSNSTCFTLFSKYLHMSPINYLLEFRIEKAAHLLSATDIAVSEVAEMTGFTSPSYFSECFRKKYGVSPSTYRDHLNKVY